jgi:hypothetical protein
MISRGSGRSAVSAAAYRSGERLTSQSLGAAAYRSGEELRGEDGEIVHDYTKRNGVEHNEIMLPQNAPPRYNDRQTLWNAVERAEKRRDAQLAREINVALPTEFNLEEQKKLLKQYIQENFVDNGMIADFAIHHTREENPHAHIMLTTRQVTPDGFGNKNREWNSRENLVKWRENWADINNRALEAKGLDERIDHRTLKAQGIDREPTIHLGHEATALERRGIRTAKGDYNREIQHRNAERGTQKSENEQEITAQTYDLNVSKNNNGETERKALMAANRNMREIENHLRAEKAEQIAQKLQQQRAARELAEINPRMDEIENEFFISERELRNLKAACNELKQDIPPLEYRAENVDEYAQNVSTKHKEHKRSQEERQKARFWELDKKSYWDRQIRQAERELENARRFFARKFKIEPEQAPEEIQRIQKIIRQKRHELAEKEDRIQKIYDRQDALRTEYQALQLRKDLHRDDELIRQHAKAWVKEIDRQNQAAQAARDRLIWEQIEQRLNTISDKDFQKALLKLPYEEAQTLTQMRELLREQRRLNEAERERTRTIGRSR